MNDRLTVRILTRLEPMLWRLNDEPTVRRSAPIMRDKNKRIQHIEDLTPDPNNANRGTPYGHSLIEQSIRRHGAGRSGLAANDGTMIAGSQTLEEMAALGMKIKPVHTTGDEWVVVIRDDVEPGSQQATLLAVEDNRAAQVGIDFDPAVLAALAEDDGAIRALWSDDGWATMLATLDTPDIEFKEYDESNVLPCAAES